MSVIRETGADEGPFREPGDDRCLPQGTIILKCSDFDNRVKRLMACEFENQVFWEENPRFLGKAVNPLHLIGNNQDVGAYPTVS